MKKTLLIILCTVFVYAHCLQAQNRFLQIQVNTNTLQRGDTLIIDADYVDDYNEPQYGTLFAKILDTAYNSVSYRWPIIKGYTTAKIAIPTSLAYGMYKIYFASTDITNVLQGKVINNYGLQNLDATIITKGTLIATKDIAITERDSIYYDAPYFVGDVVVNFANPFNQASKPNISLVTPLDSVFTPTVTKFITFTVGDIIINDKSKNQIANLPTTYNNIDKYIANKKITSGIITVKAKVKKPINAYSDKYVTGVFNIDNVRTLNLLDQLPNTGQTILQYLTANIPNFIINAADVTRAYYLRNNAVTFYLDEMEIGEQILETINIDDVAMIKTYNPPFIGNTDISNAAIAIYSKQVGFGSGGRNVFKVKGYSPVINTLMLKK